jgi:hypothetical protein
LTGNATNFTTVNVRKGTTAMASYAVDTPTIDDLVADTPKAMALAAAGADRVFTAGDSLNINKAETGTGMAITAAAVVGMWFRIGSQDFINP